MKKRLEQAQITIDNQIIPIKIYREARRNVRASMGKTAFILRMPRLLLPVQERKHIQWFEDWIKATLQKHPNAKAQFTQKQYNTGDIIQVGERRYTLKISHENLKQHHAKLADGIIYLRLNPNDDVLHLNKSIKTLLSRVIGNDFLPKIEKRVQELNEQYFQKTIKRVSLKYNQSNWGSCSTKNNINLSTRLLFAPPIVIDYVIIHELAHLVEMNHSERFWKIVADIIPDYKVQEKWLKDNRASCDF